MGATIMRLASAPRPWPDDLLADVRLATDHTMAHTASDSLDHFRVVQALLHATATDLAALIDADPGGTAER